MTARARIPESVSYFDRTAHRWANQYDRPTVGGHVLRERRDQALELLAGRNGRLLDVGCGSCVLVPDIVARGFEYWGVDGAFRMVQEGRGVGGTVGRLCVADVAGLPFPDASFDAVVCLGVIDRVVDPGATAREMARVVKPGGIIVTSFLNRWSPYYAWRLGVFYPVVRLVKAGMAAATHRRDADLVTRAWRFTPRSAGHLFADPAFSVVATSYYNFNVLLPPLDEVFPRTAAAAADRLAALADTPLRSLGGGFLAAAVRNPSG